MGMVTNYDWISTKEEMDIIDELAEMSRRVYMNEAPRLKLVDQYIEFSVSAVDKPDHNGIFGNYSNGRVVVYVVNILKYAIMSVAISDPKVPPMYGPRNRFTLLDMIKRLAITMTIDTTIHEIFHSNQNIFTNSADRYKGTNDDPNSRRIPLDSPIEDSVYDITLRYLYQDITRIEYTYRTKVELGFLRSLRIERLKGVYGQTVPKYGAAAFQPITKPTLCESSLIRLLGKSVNAVYGKYSDAINASKEYLVRFTSEVHPEFNAEIMVRHNSDWDDTALYELSRITSLISKYKTHLQYKGRVYISENLEAIVEFKNIVIDRNVFVKDPEITEVY